MIDIYCERISHGLWAEPVNAFTNLAFLAAAFGIWRFAKQRDALSVDVWLLIGLMISIGIGSGFFHTFATHWARVLDIVPILLFQLAYLWIYGQKIIRMRSIHLAVAVALFLVAAYLGRQYPHLLNGSLIYAPAFMLLAGLGMYHYYHARRQRSLLLWATGVFLLSLFFRTIDLEVCEYASLGTHFLWHLLNGVLVYLAVLGLLTNLPESGGNRT